MLTLTDLMNAPAPASGWVLAQDCEETGLDPADIRAEMARRIGEMRDSIERGLSSDAKSITGMVGWNAKGLWDAPDALNAPLIRRVQAYAMAVNEENARMGRIVAAPSDPEERDALRRRLIDAEAVRVLWVNPGEKAANTMGRTPGEDLAATLARQGVKCELSSSVTAGLEVGDDLLSRLADFGADLLVMGCYGHSRLREFVMGGATREILRHMTVPVLMSH